MYEIPTYFFVGGGDRCTSNIAPSVQFPHPNIVSEQVAASALSSTLGAKSETRKSDNTSTSGISNKRLSAADTAFERVLEIHRILSDESCYAQDLPDVPCNNLDRIQHALAVSRASLSPSRRDPFMHKQFKRANAAISETKTIHEVMPFLRGTGMIGENKIANEQNLLFNNLASLTGGVTVDPKPDMFDGAWRRQIHDQVQSDLDAYIIPTKHPHAPIAPNYFFEVKSRSGSTEEARRQIVHDVAAGSRAMNALRTYRQATTLPYDGNAYTLGTTYHGSGVVKIYAGHMQPGPSGPETYVNEVSSFLLTRDVDSFYEGVGAFRNARDLAYKLRNELIASANAKAQPVQHQSQNRVLEHGDGDESGEDEDEDLGELNLPPSVITPVLNSRNSRNSTTRRSSSIATTTRSKRPLSPSSPQGHRVTRSRAAKRR